MAIEMLTSERSDASRPVPGRGEDAGQRRRTSIDQRPGMNLRVVADLVTEALSSLGRPEFPVVICSGGLTAIGVGPTDLLGPLQAAAEQHGRSRDHYERALEQMPLETPESDLCLARWNRAGLQHEQSMLLISYLRESAAA